MSTYQGHLADGSSVQKHSAGGLYPLVVAVRDTDRGRRYELIGPGIDTALVFDSYDACIAGGERLLAVRENQDAWAFELEQLCYVALQKQAAMTWAAKLLGSPARWAEMSKVGRVQSLLRLGAVRNRLCLPMTQRPAFAELAARVA